MASRVGISFLDHFAALRNLNRAGFVGGVLA